MARRRVFLPLDKLIVGAASTEPRRPFLTMPPAAVPLSEKDQRVLRALEMRRSTGRLPYQDEYKYQTLAARRAAGGTR